MNIIIYFSYIINDVDVNIYFKCLKSGYICNEFETRRTFMIV